MKKIIHCVECAAPIEYLGGKIRRRCIDCRREANRRRHAKWYVQNRQNNSTWQRHNKRAAKEWREKNSRRGNEQPRPPA